MVKSKEPDTTVLPSGLIATLDTALVCPLSVVLHSPEARSHTLVWEGFGEKISHHHRAESNQHEATHHILLYPQGLPEPEIMVLLSGLTATLFTQLMRPSNVFLSSPDARFHTLDVWEGFEGKLVITLKQIAVSVKRLTAQYCRPSPTRWSCHLGLWLRCALSLCVPPASSCTHRRPSPTPCVVWEGFGVGNYSN